MNVAVCTVSPYLKSKNRPYRPSEFSSASKCNGAVDVVVGMDVGVGEVAGAHGDEVAERAKVWLEVGDHLAVLAHRQGDLHLAACRGLRIRIVIS